MKKILQLLLVISICFLSQPSFASFADPLPSSWTKQTNYGDKTVHKLGFGLLNLTLGWTAIPYRIDKHSNDNVYTGMAEGAWLTLTNTLGGVLHLVTFPLPLDIPLPAGGVQFE